MLFCRAKNGLKHAVDVAQHFVVPEAKDKVAHGFQHLRPRGIRFGLHGMLAAINLDNEMRVLAAEIDNELRKRHLPPKFQVSQATIPKPKPKLSLGIGLIMPKTPSFSNN